MKPAKNSDYFIPIFETNELPELWDILGENLWYFNHLILRKIFTFRG